MVTEIDNQKILEKAIKKALSNGWDDPFGIRQFNLVCDNRTIDKANPNSWCSNGDFITISTKRWGGLLLPKLEHYNLSDIFFDRDWWSIKYKWNCGYALWGSNWKKHLTKMLVADDPIKYLGENI